MNQELLDLAALTAQVVERARQTLPDGSEVELMLPGNVVDVWADCSRIEEVLSNLLDNAVKYSRPGAHITVEIEQVDTGGSVRVRDQGMGLSADAAEAIFKPFGRASNAKASGVAGMGLGLFICQQIPERHGSWIRAESRGEGSGTTMTMWLPAVASHVSG